jgi:DNA-cytosine methyltransferase
VYNFEVETDNSYIVENTIVHNCQGFSNAGHRLGLLDYRGTLFYEIARIVEHHKPRILLLENVKHILTIQGGEVLRTILETFRGLGYAMKTVTMSPDEFGIPQNRQRVYFMGVRGLEGEVAPPPAPVRKNPNPTSPLTRTSLAGAFDRVRAGTGSSAN